MPKNKGKGGKNRRRGKNENETEKRELVYAEEGQCYGQVLRMLGNGRLEAFCFHDEKKRLCHIRGKMRKKVWVSTGDIVLVGLRDFQDDKADIIHKYYPEEARELKKRGELPASAKINDMAGAGAGGDAGAAAEGVEGAYEFDEGDEESVGGGEINIDEI